MLAVFRVAGILLFFALPAPALAGPDAGEIAAAWGLLGTWSEDCAQPPSRESARLSFVRVDGRLMHRRDFGANRDEFQVTAARVRPDGLLEIELDLAVFSQRRVVVFAKLEEGKKRAILNRAAGGDHSIRDGKFVASGAPTPVQTRCDALTN